MSLSRHMTTPKPSKSPKKNLWLLGLVSLFTDMSSQMIWPLVPDFLLGMGATTPIIGLIEGIGEAVASLFKAVSGKLSDRYQRRKVFVGAGYGLSALAKPLLFLATGWLLVLAVKFFDRLGKAIRNPARDALLANSVPADQKGKAFGIHRSMDRAGAMIGPALALLVLYFCNEEIRWVFLFAGIPALMALLFIPYVREVKVALSSRSEEKAALDARDFKKFLAVMILFTLGNSSNAFLILKAGEVGIPLLQIPILWMLYNGVCTIAAPIFGSLSDRVGRRPIILASLGFYALLYLGFAYAGLGWQVWILFAAYGIYYGLSNGVYRAYIADLVPPSQRATAYGYYHTGVGLALLPASLIMGYVWHLHSSQAAFLLCVVMSLLALGLMLLLSRS